MEVMGSDCRRGWKFTLSYSARRAGSEGQTLGDVGGILEGEVREETGDRKGEKA